MLKRLRNSNLNKIFLYPNINSITSRSGDLDKIAEGNIHTLCLADNKLDKSFSNNESIFWGLTYTIQVRYNDKKFGLIRFVTLRIPSRRLTDFQTQCNIQITAFEINVWKEKWLVALRYVTPSHNKKCFFHI